MNANEVILRYFAAWFCGWLSKHGLPGFDDNNIVVAVTSDVLSYGVPLLIVARALYTSTFRWTMERMKSRHRVELLDGAASVPGVSKIEATHELALATDSPKVVSASGGPV